MKVQVCHEDSTVVASADVVVDDIEEIVENEMVVVCYIHKQDIVEDTDHAVVVMVVVA